MATLHPTSTTPVLLFQRALEHLANEAFLESLSILELLRSYHPDFGPAYCYLGLIHMNVYSDYAASESYFQKAFELSPDFPDTYHLFAEYLNRIRHPKALQELQKKSNQVPGVRIELLMYQVGISQERQGNYDKAIATYKGALPLAVEEDLVDELAQAIDRCHLKMEAEAE